VCVIYRLAENTKKLQILDYNKIIHTIMYAQKGKRDGETERQKEREREQESIVNLFILMRKFAHTLTLL